MNYDSNHTAQISFPLGGIGSGCVGLSGNGHLIDWEIFNAPGKGRYNGLSHFAVRAEKAGKVVDFRLLHGDETTGLQGVYASGDDGYHAGFGGGPRASLMCGWPHFRSHRFVGEFPFARVGFDDPHFPGHAELEAWSPFIPGNSRDSSLPAACFTVELANTTEDALDYSCIGVLANPWKQPGHVNRYSGRCLTMESGLPESDFGRGDLTLMLADDSVACSGQSYFYRDGGWNDDREMYYNDVMRGGRFIPRDGAPSATEREDHGLLAAHFRLAPGERRKITFILTWSIPVRQCDWNPYATAWGKLNGVENRWRNYYATQWENSTVSAGYLAENLRKLESDTRLFHDAWYDSSMPPEVVDGVSANFSVLRSATCLRLEDGTFYGWEGVWPHWGSCQGSCTHVWNYTQTLPFLFPDLERSMRESHLKYSVDENGGAHFRLMLPLGIRATTHMFRPCADGQFGDIMKFYRDWKLSGDNGWLEKWYPTLKKMVQYAWSDKNPDRWDPDRTGVLQGRQHHTLDMELFGPNAWLTGHYLGALDAIARMADTVNDSEFAAECRALRSRGQRIVEETLFNGEYYHQQIDLKDRSIPARYDADSYWNAESGEIKYQLGDGCGIDSHLAQLYAVLYGLAPIFDPERNRVNLKSIFRYNFKRSFRDVFNPWRIFCLNDESGVMICTWPHGNRPAISLPYHTETMHGYEWAFAAHLAAEGMEEEALTVAKSIRDRYDGAKRNPWNEMECGGNYARSMAAYALLPAMSGFRYDLTAGMIGFEPPTGERALRCFWSVDGAWGRYEQTGDALTLRVLYGALELKAFQTRRTVASVELDGKPVAFRRQEAQCCFEPALRLAADSELRFLL